MFTPTVLILTVGCISVIIGLVAAALINVYFVKKNEEHVRHISLIGKILANAAGVFGEKVQNKVENKEEEKHEES